MNNYNKINFRFTNKKNTFKYIEAESNIQALERSNN